MSFGTGIFGFGLGYTPPTSDDEAPVTLVSSQEIDLVAGTLSYDDDGNEEGMDDTAQRILLCARTAKLPTIMGEDFEAAVENELRIALQPVTGGTPPDATIVSIEVARHLNGCRPKITYRNNLTDTETSITL